MQYCVKFGNFFTIKIFLIFCENKKLYSSVPNNSAPPSCLFIFGFFVGPPFLIWTPQLNNFPDFVLQIFQRLLKRIVFFAKLQEV